MELFTRIQQFVVELASTFRDNKPLVLYAHLLKRTQPQHTRAIARHNTLFAAFCAANADAIRTKDAALLACPEIAYSDKVHFDIAALLAAADKDTQDAIWAHLAAIASPKEKQPLDFASLFAGMVDSLQEAVGPLLEQPPDVAFGPENASKVVATLFESGAMQQIAGQVKQAFEANPPSIEDIMRGIQQFCADQSQADTDAPPFDASVLQSQLFSMLPAMAAAGPDAMPAPAHIESMLAGLCATLSVEGAAGTEQNRSKELTSNGA